MKEYSKNTNLDDFLQLRVANKDKDWFIFQADRLIPSHANLVVEDAVELKKLYEFANNDLSGFRSEIDRYCGNLFSETEEELIPYNPLPNKIEVLKGDLLARGNNHKIVLLTAKAIQSKNKEFWTAINSSVEQELSIAIQKQKAIMEGMSEKEVSEYIETLKAEITPADINRKNFLSESEILYNKLLQYTYYDQDVTPKKLEAFEDLIKVDRFFVYCGWRHGKPYFKVCNPLHVGFDKNPNVPFAQDADYVWYRDEITVADALQEYGNRLDKEDLKKVIQHGQTFNGLHQNHMGEPLHDLTRFQSLLTHLGETLNKGVGLHQGTSLTNVNLTKTLWRTHLEFKAFTQLIFVTVTDEYNEKVTFTVDKNTSIIPSDASKVKFTDKWMNESEKYIWSDETNEYEAEILYVPRRYELTRIQNDIVLDYREVPYQPDNTDNPFERFELSYKGGIMNSRNSKFISRMMRAIPNALQYMAVKRIQDREIAAYIGQETVIDVDQTPDELGVDNESNPQEGQDRVLKADIIARKTKKRYTSSSRSSNGLPPPPTRSSGVQYNMVDASGQLMNLQQLCSMLDAETGMRMGIPPQREGQVQSNTNVTDNRQAQLQSTLSTQTDFFFLDRVFSHVLNEHLYNLRTWLKMVFQNNPNLKNHQLEYFLPDGARELLEVTPNQLEQLEDIGLYLHDAGKDYVYFNFMTSPQVIQAFAQNQAEGVEAMSGMLKALTNSQSVEEIHKKITDEADKQRKRQEQLMQQQALAEQEAIKAQQEQLKYVSDLKLQGELQKIDAESFIKLRQAELDSDKFMKQNDVNQNQLSDTLEKEREQRIFEAQENSKQRSHEIEIEKLKGKFLSKRVSKN
jgi:hypothetical protein